MLGQVDVITLEPHRDWLNLPNGMLDWRTGTLHDHDESYWSTSQLAVTWSEDAECPEIERFLAEVLPADLLEPGADGSPGFIYEVIGYALFSGNPLHKAILLLGTGRNGKGTLLRLLNAMLGEDNVSSVALHEMANNRFRVAELVGKVANIAGTWTPDGWRAQPCSRT